MHLGTTAKQSLPIGVFDSGMGGLTVLAELTKKLPSESFLYLGDTARLPYGTKSQATVVKYAMQMAEILIAKGIKLLVIACNTATTAAIKALKLHYPELPIIGVIEPGAKAAVQASHTNKILLLATETTVRSKIYNKFIQQQSSINQVTSLACGLFVALAEEGCIDDEVAKVVVRKYLSQIDSFHFDCILLGCTHFPVFKTLIQAYVGDDINIVDSAVETAKAVKAELDTLSLSTNNLPSQIHYLVTDLPERFTRIGEFFLQDKIDIDKVEVVDVNQGLF